MDDHILELKKAAKELSESRLIKGYLISDNMIYREESMEYRMDVPIKKLNLSVRSNNALYRAGLNMLSNVLLLSVEELAKVKNLGAKSVEEILLVAKNYLRGTGEIRDTDTEDSERVLPPVYIKSEREPEPISVQSKLIEGYCISDHIIYTSDFQMYMKDVGIDEIGYSGRLRNLLCRQSMFRLTDILSLSPTEAMQAKDLGRGMMGELTEKTEAYLSSHMKSVHDDGKVIVDEMIEDTPYEEMTLDLLPLSVRASNALAKRGYHYIDEIADFTYYDFLSIQNLGAKTAKEIYEKTQLFLRANSVKKQRNAAVIHTVADADVQTADAVAILKKFRQECEERESQALLKTSDHLLEKVRLNDPLSITTIREAADVYRLASVINAVDKSILSLLKEHEIEGVSFTEIKSALPSSMQTELLSERLDTLIEKKTVKYAERYFVNYPSFVEIISEDPDDRSAQVIVMRTQGMTLEEIAQVQGGLTRERVRQIEAKYMRKLFTRYGHLDEDKYGYLYSTYELTNELMENYLGFSKATVYFLEYKYKGVGKKRPIDEKVPDDPKIPTLLKKQIEKYILSNKIQIGNDYVEAKLHLVEDALFPILCKETITFDDYIERLNDYVAAHHKPELIVSGNNLRTRSNKCAQSKLILWTLNQKMRYYDTEEIDKAEFLHKLNLNQYHDIEISAKKLLDENLDLMEEYDIRNEYELHNLLKKILEPSDCPGLVLGRSPIMQFGNADRGKQVVDLLAQLTPISQYDFADAYSELYGVPSATVMANYIPYVKQYINRDKILEMDVPSLSVEEVNRLKEILINDFYPIDRMRDIIHREFPDMSPDKINHYTLRQLGFTVYSGYVIRSSYRNAQEYFTALLTADDIIDTNPFPSEIFYIQSYYAVLTTLTDNYELIEFMPKKYIKMSRLTELFGTTKDDLIHFCEHVREFTAKQYFTVRSLRQEGFDDKLFELGFDDWFYSSVLASDKEHFAHRKYGGNMIFKVGTQSFLFSDFVEWLVYREESMSIDVYELVETLSGTYGIRFDRYDIKWKILPGTSMYYNEITEKLYADYEIYFDEI